MSIHIKKKQKNKQNTNCSPLVSVNLRKEKLAKYSTMMTENFNILKE